MKLAFAWAFVLCLGANAGSVGNAGHPIEKVINMLDGLKAKAIVEGKQEAAAYQKFTYWCSTSIDELKDAISDEKEKIAELEDLLAGKNKEKESLEEEISDLEDQLKELEASADKAKKQRKKESDLYTTTLKDLKGTIAAVGSALQAVSKAQSKTEGLLLAQRNMHHVLALISLDSSVTDEQRSTLQAFADGKPKDRPEQLAKGDLGDHVDHYDFKSESVIELLKNLKLKFQDDMLAVTTAETNAVNSYDLAKAARDNAIKAAKNSKGKKTGILAKVKDTIATAEGDLSNEQDDKKTDSKTLSDTEEQCHTKKEEWEERSKTRELEIEAMEMAKKILSKVGGVRTEAPGNPVPPPSPVNFLQVSSDGSPKLAAVALLREAAKATHSHALERLAMEVNAHLSGPFDAVNNMIEKMIFRLMDEQKQEDEHKLWCDQEIEKTETMKEDKEDKIADLKAEIKTENGAIANLAKEIQAAEEMLADITAFVKEATEVREIGKKENAEAIKDSVAAQTALENAIAVLEDHYKKSGAIKKEPWEFIQEPVKLPENPATWDSGYTEVANPTAQPSGIVSVLETVMADFAKMEAETKSQEAVDQKEYDQSMSDNQIEKARRTKEAEMKTNEKTRRSEKVTMLESQKKDTANELEKTEQYLKDLEPACVTGDSSYEDRKKARATEIKALKKAKDVLAEAFNGATNGAGKKFLQIGKHEQRA